MNPSVPELNLNWGFTPQQEQNLSVSKGMEAIASNIDESVRRKIEQDRQYDENLNNILKSTTGRYQKEILDQINKSKEEIKNIGKVNWNNAELRMKRSEILQDLTSVSQKANYVAQVVPQINKAIDDSKYIIKDEAKNAVIEELKKPVSQINIDKLEQIAGGTMYVNHSARMMDAVDNYLKKDVHESMPFVTRANGMITTNQFLFRNNYRAKKNPDGSYVIDKNTGMPVLEETLDNAQVDDILRTTGDYQGSYNYFKKLYEADPSIKTKLKDSDGDSYNQAILSYAKSYINNITHPYEPKLLNATREYVPRTTKPTAADTQAQRAEENVAGIYQMLKSNDSNGLRNILETKYGKDATNFVHAPYYRNGYYKEPSDKVLSTQEMIDNGYLELRKSGAVFTQKGIKRGFKPFTGLYIKIPRGTDGSKKDKHIAFEGQIQDEKQVKKLARAISNSTFEKGDSPYRATDSKYTSSADIPAYENYNNQEWTDIYNSLPSGAQYMYNGEVRIKG